MVVRPGGKRTESDQVVAMLRRSAAKSLLGIAALAFVCNLGTLAVPLVNMQVFNLVLGVPTTFIAGEFLARSKPPADAVLP